MWIGCEAEACAVAVPDAEVRAAAYVLNVAAKATAAIFLKSFMCVLLKIGSLLR
jgi:hypothetical protein